MAKPKKLTGNCFTVGVKERYRQCVILLKKNFILTIRNRRATALQILVPIIFVLFLYALQFALQANQRLSADIRSVPVSFNQEISPIPRCIIGTNNSLCYTFGYAPSRDSNVGLIMDQIMQSNNIPPQEVISFQSETEADIFLSQNPNTTQGVYLVQIDYGCEYLPPALAEECYAANHTLSEVIGIQYVIQYNFTEQYYRGSPIDPIFYILLPMQKAFDRAVFTVFAKPFSTPDYEVDVYPFAHPELVAIDIVGSTGPYFFFGALMFNFVIQIGAIVSEKQNKLRETLRVMGLKDFSFWVSWAITNITMNTVSCLLLIVTGVILQFNFFLKNDFPTYFFLFFLFGLSMVPLAFLVSTFIMNASTATSVGFIIFLVGSIIQAFATTIFRQSTAIGWRILFSFFPFAILAKGLSDLGSAANGDNGTGIRWSDRGTYGFFPLTDQYDWLLLDTAIFFVLSWFFDNLIYLKRPPWFMFTRTYWCGPRKKAKMSDDEEEDNFIELKNFLPDEDVIKEEEIIKQKKYGDNVVVVINRLTKTYTRTRCFCCKDKSQTFRAVKGIYLTIEIGRLLCLLGHNGAGKTTTISMLTGLLTPTSGDAVIFGDSIHSGMEKIRRVMGVCPQHDILWTKLTAREHLEMFAALKGLKAKDISKEVEERLRDVDLVKVANITAGNYSGGMKRRLSVAISLVGDPDIVFLDEPTTGMDPVSRRKVWNLIEKVKHNRVVLLTTHSMEEADILGDKIAIMKEGRIAALGTSIHLKNRYGAGYSIHIVGDETKMEQVKEFVLQELGKNESAEKKEKAAKKKRKTKTKTKAKKEKAEPITSTNNDVRIEFTSVVPGIINFRIPLVLTKKMAQFFKHIEEAKKDLHIEDVQLSMTTLEEVFLRVAESPEVREIVHRKIKTYKAHFIAMGIFFGLLFLAAIGLSVVFRPVNIPPQPLQAPYRGPEPPPFVPNATLDYGTFQWGIQTGDVTNTSALVSLHTNATSVNMQLLVANANISWEVVTTVDNITVANGLVQLLLTGLEPDTAYSVWFYQTADPNSRSYVARFRTAVSESTPIRKIVFGATCCLGLTDSPWYSLGKAAEEELDFFLLLGDTTYADYSQTLAQFTAAWNSTLSTEGFRNLSLSTSFIATWDDHELTYNWQFQNTPQFIALYDTALQAFRNAIPQTLGPPSRSRIWRSLRWGNTLEVFVLDVRSELNSTAGYIVSDQQLQWLKDGLLNSSCVFKLIMTSLPISNLSSILGNSSNTMLWEGYPAQRDDLINYIVQNGITGVLFISGHVQFGLLTRLAQNNTFGGSLFEAVTGPSGSQINQILRLNPFLNLNSDQFLNLVNTWTYTRFEADPLSHNMTIQYIDDQGTVVNSQSLSLDFIG